MDWWELVGEVPSTLFLFGISPGDWLLFAAEVAVAAVIWMELDAGRLDRFLNELSSHYASRQALHTSIMNLREREGESWVSRIRNDDALRDQCNVEVMAISNLVLLGGRRSAQLNWMVKYGPHSLVRFWELLGDYVIEKRVADGGLWGDELLKCISLSAARLRKTQREVGMAGGRKLGSARLGQIAEDTRQLANNSGAVVTRSAVTPLVSPSATGSTVSPTGYAMPREVLEPAMELEHWITVATTAGLSEQTDRLRIEGGWLYRTRFHNSTAITFVPASKTTAPP